MTFLEFPVHTIKNILLLVSLAPYFFTAYYNLYLFTCSFLKSLQENVKFSGGRGQAQVVPWFIISAIVPSTQKASNIFPLIQ